MLTPKIIFYRHKTYADGSHPIILQVVKNGKAIRKVVGKCLPTEWLKSKNRVGSKNIRYQAINDDIDRALINFGRVEKESFFDYYQRKIELAKENGQASIYLINKRILFQFKEFSPNADFDSIDESLLEKFAIFLGKKNKVNSVRTKMQNLGKVLLNATKDGLLPKNPMAYMTFKSEPSVKSKLSLEELKKIMGLSLKGTKAEVRDIFIASILMRGIRIGDALSLTEKNIQNGRLVYREGKTGKVVNISITPELMEIFDRWKGINKHGYIFSLLSIPKNLQDDKFFFKRQITTCIVRVNSHLKTIAKLAGIEKKISSHTARHSFSVLARLTIQDTTITKDLVGHSSLAIHEIYISEIAENTVLDVYASQVLDKLK